MAKSQQKRKQKHTTARPKQSDNGSTIPNKVSSTTTSNYVPFLLPVIFAMGASVYKPPTTAAVVQQAATQRRVTSEEVQVEIIEPFLSNPSPILETLQNHDVWQECDMADPNRWLPKGAAPSNLWEELAIEIWKDSEHLAEADGYEYWCNILTPTSHLDWHQDKDESLVEELGISQHPIMGAVYYGYPHRFIGGDLEVMKGEPPQAEDDNDDEQRMVMVEVEPFQAIYNRLIRLNVTRWHQVAPILQGSRYTLAVNLWRHRPTGLQTEADRKAKAANM